jgi:hypothetical protein
MVASPVGSHSSALALFPEPEQALTKRAEAPNASADIVLLRKRGITVLLRRLMLGLPLRIVRSFAVRAGTAVFVETGRGSQSCPTPSDPLEALRLRAEIAFAPRCRPSGESSIDG